MRTRPGKIRDLPPKIAARKEFDVNTESVLRNIYTTRVKHNDSNIYTVDSTVVYPPLLIYDKAAGQWVMLDMDSYVRSEGLNNYVYEIKAFNILIPYDIQQSALQLNTIDMFKVCGAESILGLL